MDTTARTAILVTGMHRSGTSVLTRALSVLGARLPETLIPGRDTKGDSDYYESRAVVDVNQDILRAAGTWWAGWQEVDTAALPHRDELLDRVRSVVRSEYAGAPLVVVKDPRISRMLPLWTEALEQEGYRCVHVLALRHPERVAASLQRRDGLIPKAGGLGWLAHVLDAERDTRDAPRVVVALDSLVADWRTQVRRMEEALGIAWPRTPEDAEDEVDSVFDAGLARRTTVPVPLGHGVHEVLERWGADRVLPADAAFLERWRTDFGPIRRVPSPTVAIRERGGDALTALPGWQATEHHGYSCEARGAWAWLQQVREATTAPGPTAAAGEPSRVRRLARRVVPGRS